jgi:hypothetical protein
MIRLLHWEYWSFSVVYTPIYPYWFWLCFRARAFFFFNAANPFIRNGGFLMESKKEIYDLLPAHTYPPTLFFPGGTNIAMVTAEVEKKGFSFPLICKPDIGMRGMSVQKVLTTEDLIQYASACSTDFLVQEYIPYELEAGIFYYRIPGEPTGHITGIVSKEFLTVTGDGQRTIEALMQEDKRYILQLPAIRKQDPALLEKVLSAGEKYVVVPYGNHSRGAKFLDYSFQIDTALLKVMDTIADQTRGFHYGRMDIRFNSWEELKAGKNFSIIELNGAGSEPTHMYDPQHSIWYAWKEITRHWKILWRISLLNHQKGYPYMTTKQGLDMLKANKELVGKISN